jgi:hypothetical protein
MATSFPSGLDALTNPTSGDTLASPDHAAQHANVNDAVEALEAKVGVDGSAVVTSLDYKITNGIFSALAVDTNVLVVDATNNRVGVNTASPGTAVDVVGTATVRAAATQDGVALTGRAGGTSSYEVTLTPTTLTGDQALTLPNATGTVITTGNLTDFTVTAGTTSTGATGVGYMGLPQNATTTGAYTIVAADAGKHIYSTATRTVTIPSNASLAMPIGSTIVFIAATGATVTIAITTDTMYLAGPGTTGSRTLAAFGMATAVKITSTSWIISGNGLT